MESLIKELQVRRELFVRQLDDRARNWFTRRIVKHVQSQPDPKPAATAMLTKAKTLATARLVAGRRSLLDDLGRAKQNEIRARIVYGTLGNFPGIFLDGTGQNTLLDFIVERRFRSVQRMSAYVNPNDARGIIGYPPGVTTSQVNQQSRAFWEGVSILGNGKVYPFILSALGRTKPRETIESLFIKNKKKSDRTLIDCPAVITLVHMDALLAAKDPDKMAKALANEGGTYVAIDHPYGSSYLTDIGYIGGFGGWLNQPASQGDNVDLKTFIGLSGIPTYPVILMDGNGKEQIKITDLKRDKITNAITGGELKSRDIYIEANPLVQSTLRVDRLSRSFSPGSHISPWFVDWFNAVGDDRPGKALFDRSFIVKDDLQVGDHVFLTNHPLHISRIGSTPWNGEHSLVLDPWTANPFEIRIIGHGIREQTVLQLTYSMLEEINIFLDVTRAIVDKWLALPPGRTPDSMSAGEATPRQKSFLAQFLLRANPIPFNGKIRVFNMPALPYHRGGKTKTYPGYWIMDLEGNSDNTLIDRRDVLLFDYDPMATKARPWKEPWPPRNPVAVLRPAGLAALGGEAKRHYAVSYIDQQIGLELLMPLYHPLQPHKGRPVRINFDHVKRSVFFGLSDGKVFVTRPRVAADSNYLAHLKQIGAIAP